MTDETMKIEGADDVGDPPTTGADDTSGGDRPDASPDAAANGSAGAGDDASAAGAGDDGGQKKVPDENAPARPAGRLKIPDDTKGHYVVIWARRPARGDDTRPAYQEVDCLKASGPEAAKRAVMADDAPFSAFLKHSAAQKPGILLRAVPAMHWPRDVKPTTYERPDPVLTIG